MECFAPGNNWIARTEWRSVSGYQHSYDHLLSHFSLVMSSSIRSFRFFRHVIRQCIHLLFSTSLFSHRYPHTTITYRKSWPIRKERWIRERENILVPSRRLLCALASLRLHPLRLMNRKCGDSFETFFYLLEIKNTPAVRTASLILDNWRSVSCNCGYT